LILEKNPMDLVDAMKAVTQEVIVQVIFGYE